MREQAEATASSEGIKNGVPVRQRRRWSQEEKGRLVEEWKQSGKSRALFCRENNLNYLPFLGWIRDQAVGTGGFVEINLKSNASLESDLIRFDLAELVSPNGWRIRLPRQWKEVEVGELLRFISQC